MKPILFIAHSEAADGGRLAAQLRMRGYPIEFARPVLGGDLPRDLSALEACVVLGGPMSANDTHLPGISDELAWLERAFAADLPLLGSCLGGQLMAKVLGAPVWMHPEGDVEIGFFPLTVTDLGRDVLPDDMHVYHWHKEGFDLPPGADLLATGDAFPVQGFRYDGRHFGFQFHPEMTPTRMTKWHRNVAKRMGPRGVHPVARQWRDQSSHDVVVDNWLPQLLDIWLRGAVRA